MPDAFAVCGNHTTVQPGKLLCQGKAQTESTGGAGPGRLGLHQRIENRGQQLPARCQSRDVKRVAGVVGVAMASKSGCQCSIRDLIPISLATARQP